MTGSGGWPMSVFCTPDGRPFFAGTYYPPVDRPGMPGLRRRLVTALADAWSTQRAEVERQADELAAGRRRAGTPVRPLAPPAADGASPGSPSLLGPRRLRRAGRALRPRVGRLRAGPQVPPADLVELCLRHAPSAPGAPNRSAWPRRRSTPWPPGGIYDHLAGGFARYSTDRQWLVPHFEKMLTDQALLARGYLHAWQAHRPGRLPPGADRDRSTTCSRADRPRRAVLVDRRRRGGP